MTVPTAGPAFQDEAQAATPHTDDIELLDITETCKFLGGKNRPIDRATLYRGIKKGRYPKPVKPGPGISRWVKAELTAVVRAMMDSRD